MPPRKNSTVQSAAGSTAAAVAEAPKTLPSLKGLNLSGLKPPAAKPVVEAPDEPVEEVKTGKLSGLKKLTGKLEGLKAPAAAAPSEEKAASPSGDNNLINAKFAELQGALKDLTGLIKSTFVDFQQKLDRTVDQSADAISRMLRLEESYAELVLGLDRLGKDPSERLKDHNAVQVASLAGPEGGETPSDILTRLGLTVEIAEELSAIVGTNIGQQADSVVKAVGEQLEIPFDDIWALFMAFGWIDLNRALYMS
jgi:hypothetical protein